jgi:hypothetical protein
MSGLFAALCVHSSNSPVAGLTTFFWAALAGICEYYVGADVSRDEIEWLVEKAISAAKECVLKHNAEGAAVAAAVIECTVVQLIDNMTRIMQHPELYDLDDYVRLKGVDVGVHVYTPRDDLSAKFEDLNDEATLVAILAHDLIDYGRDIRNNNNNNLCLKLGDMDQLWDMLV